MSVGRRVLLAVSSRVSIVAFFALGACSERQPDVRGDFVDLYLDDGIEVCGGQVESFDRFVDAFFRQWTDDAPPAGFHAAISVEVSGHCGDLNCASSGHGWLKSDFGQFHELAHVMHFFLDGRAPLSLSEGVAETVGTNGVWYRAAELAELEPSFLYRDSIDGYEYGYAAAFTRFLIEAHGILAFRGFFREMRDARLSETSYRSKFESEFGVALDDDWQRFVAGNQCGYQHWFCGPDAVFDRIELPYEMDGIECASPRVMGFDATGAGLADERYARDRVLRFVLNEAATVDFTLEYASAYVNRCGSCDEQVSVPYPLLRSEDDLAMPLVIPLALEAGEYAIIARSLPGGEPKLRLGL